VIAAAAPPSTDDRAGIALFREVLDDAGYEEARVGDALELGKLLDRRPWHVPAYVHLLRDGDRLATLIRLLLLGLPVPVDEAAAAFASIPLERLERIGILTRAGEDVRGCFELAPVEGALIASDASQAEGHLSDHVLGITPGTLVLDALTVRRPVASALDLGTGSGLLAVHAAAHADRVVAVDINARALRFAEFNAALNAVENVDWREGSLFEPVAGEQFDLVVCNPPYYISPELEVVFRDSSMPGDSFCEAVVRGLPAHLEEGGLGHVLVSWVHGDEEDWRIPLARWLEGSGCDVLLLRYRTWAPLAYSASANRPAGTPPERYEAVLDRWLDYYREQSIERISWGAIVLRRRTAPDNWTWTHEPSAKKIDPASEHVLRLFEAQDLLRSADGLDSLLAEPFALVPEHRVYQTLRLDGGDGSRTMLRLGGGLRFEVEVDDATLSLLSRLDGRRTLGQALEELDPGGETALAGAALPAVARLLELGFVVTAR
jgi:methylase of polypeptide subunit release factors